jgi:hypothetical protein
MHTGCTTNQVQITPSTLLAICSQLDVTMNFLDGVLRPSIWSKQSGGCFHNYDADDEVEAISKWLPRVHSVTNHPRRFLSLFQRMASWSFAHLVLLQRKIQMHNVPAFRLPSQRQREAHCRRFLPASSWSRPLDCRTMRALERRLQQWELQTNIQLGENPTLGHV